MVKHWQYESTQRTQVDYAGRAPGEEFHTTVCIRTEDGQIHLSERDLDEVAVAWMAMRKAERRADADDLDDLITLTRALRGAP